MRRYLTELAPDPVSGGAFNPAVGIGPILVDVVLGDGSMGNLWFCIVGPLVVPPGRSRCSGCRIRRSRKADLDSLAHPDRGAWVTRPSPCWSRSSWTSWCGSWLMDPRASHATALEPEFFR